MGALIGGSDLSEKQELTVLNARLMQYIRHMRESKSFSKVSCSERNYYNLKMNICGYIRKRLLSIPFK